MHRHFRLASLAASSLVIALVIAGCGDDTSDPAPSGENAPPSEATVFNASGDTKSDLGIVKWGFATDESGDLMTYRGYGEKNEVLATVVQQMDRTSSEKYVFTMKMTGPSANASETIEFTARPTDDGQNTAIVMLVTENTFGEGSVPARVLTHFQADSAARTGTTAGSGSLVGKSHPLDDQLVTRCNATTNCQTELIDSRIAANAKSSACGLINTVGTPLISCLGGALVGGIAAIWTGPGVLAGAGIGCAAGGVPAGGVAAAQCAAARRDATKAAEDLRKCQQAAQAQCQ